MPNGKSNQQKESPNIQKWERTAAQNNASIPNNPVNPTANAASTMGP